MKNTGLRIGSGYDVHRLVSGRKLVLGGVEIDFSKGLEGHSDADVLVHAVCDAMLGAAGLGDIGEHFPDTDPCYCGISSMVLLKKCRDYLMENKLEIVNMDCTVFAQAPKISPHKEKMKNNLAQALEINKNFINIKATTTEGLGFIGQGLGIAAMCTLLAVHVPESDMTR